MSLTDRPALNFYEHVPTREFYALRLQSGRFTGAYGPIPYVDTMRLDLFTLDYDADPELLAWVQSQTGQFDLAH
jgi:hypothetical protein